MKKTKIIILCVLAPFILCIISIPLINNYQAYKVKNKLQNIPLPEDSVIAEAVSSVGKLVGNGNGMQYFGAILIHSELSLEEIKSHYSSHAESEWKAPRVDNQTSQTINVTNSPLHFSTTIDNANFYIVYLWEDSNSFFLNLDIRGH